jgi:hypothetical protein
MDSKLILAAARGTLDGTLPMTCPSQRDNPAIARRFNAGMLAHGHKSHRDG